MPVLAPPPSVNQDINSRQFRDWFYSIYALLGQPGQTLGTMAYQDANSVAITGGAIGGVGISGSTINSTPIGQTTAAAGKFTTLELINALGPTYGGTGITSYNVGDIIYCDSANHLTVLSKPSSSSVLTMTSAGVPSWKNPKYGTFYDTTTQTAAAINTAYAIKYNTTDLSNGVTVASNSRLTVSATGVYNFQFSLQLDKSSASKADVYIWARINGTDVSNSATKLTLQGSSSATVAAWNFVYSLNANDYFELMWSTTDTGCQIQYNAASSPVPAIPSVIMTVTDNISI